MNVIYEDNHILVVEKPVNMPVQGDISGDMDMLTELKDYIKKKYNKPGDVYLGLVHRLDRPVGGVMVFARTSKAASRLTAQFASKKAEKRYAAVIIGESRYEDSLFDYMVKDDISHSSYIVEKDALQAKPARLAYERAGNKEGLTLLDIQLDTGRHHQIRVQLASRNMPIWGDQRYNRAAKPGQQIALWSYSLTIEHPTQKTPMRFISIPKGELWSHFNNELIAMVNGVKLAYIDDDIIVADKPYALSVAAVDSDGESLERRLIAAFGQVYPIHRIDATTRGLVLFARNENMRIILDKAMREGMVHKYYRCTVKGVPAEKKQTMRAFGVKNSEDGFLTVFDEPKNGAKEMVTSYEVLSSGKYTSELAVELHTGRMHQIRAHLSHIGHPLLGDDKYGDREFNRSMDERKIQLVAERLVIELNDGRKLDVRR